MNPQIKLEQALHAAFPLEPVPKGPESCTSQIQWAAKLQLEGRRWPDVVGLGLHFGELDLSLSIWLDVFNPEFFDYYLPSHLKLAGMMLAVGAMPNYVDGVMETLMLQPSEDAEAPFERYGPLRRALHARLTQDQRECIAQFLDFYSTRRQRELKDQGWRSGSLPA